MLESLLDSSGICFLVLCERLWDCKTYSMDEQDCNHNKRLVNFSAFHFKFERKQVAWGLQTCQVSLSEGVSLFMTLSSYLPLLI